MDRAGKEHALLEAVSMSERSLERRAEEGLAWNITTIRATPSIACSRPCCPAVPCARGRRACQQPSGAHLVVARLLRVEERLERHFRVDDDALAERQADDHVGAQASGVGPQARLLLEVAAVQHAGELDDPAQLHLAPAPAHRGRPQRARQRVRGGAEGGNLLAAGRRTPCAFSTAPSRSCTCFIVSVSGCTSVDRLLAGVHLRRDAWSALEGGAGEVEKGATVAVRPAASERNASRRFTRLSSSVCVAPSDARCRRAAQPVVVRRAAARPRQSRRGIGQPGGERTGDEIGRARRRRHENQRAGQGLRPYRWPPAAAVAGNGLRGSSSSRTAA